MAYDLIKYRRVASDPLKMPVAIFLHFTARMVQDSRKNELDPFVIKFIGKPPDKRLS